VLDLGYRHVDVFSRRALRGNGLVVVLDAERLSPAVMQELTRELRQFETAFLAGVDLPGRSARLRMFTEDEELDFAGHPVLGAAAVLHILLSAADVEQSWTLAVAQRRSRSEPAVRPSGSTRAWIRVSHSSVRP
jgi:trans-2,3-dihydro-3-hydroxyanthranilate isomerase